MLQFQVRKLSHYVKQMVAKKVLKLKNLNDRRM